MSTTNGFQVSRFDFCDLFKMLMMVILFFRCIYMQKDTAYELQVDIEKDYSGFKKDIETISKLIDRGDYNYEETVQRVRM